MFTVTEGSYTSHSGSLCLRCKCLNLFGLFIYHKALAGFNVCLLLLPCKIAALFSLNNELKLKILDFVIYFIYGK